MHPGRCCAYADGTSEPGCAAGIAAGTTTIVLLASASAYMVSSSLSFTGDAVLKGGGATGTIIDGGGSVQVINVAPTAKVTLSGVTITGHVSGDRSTGCTGSVLHRVCPSENGNDGGGIYNVGTLTLKRVVVTANDASDGTLPTPDQCSQGVLDDGHNLVFGRGVSSDNSCPWMDADPKLAALADNGGPTQTVALQSGSAAIGSVPPHDCPQKSDQRGVARPRGGACDAGAYEFAPPAISGFTVKSPHPRR